MVLFAHLQVLFVVCVGLKKHLVVDFCAETSEEDISNVPVVQRLYSMHVEWARAGGFLPGTFCNSSTPKLPVRA